jgi:hypothetical protein
MYLSHAGCCLRSRGLWPVRVDITKHNNNSYPQIRTQQHGKMPRMLVGSIMLDATSRCTPEVVSAAKDGLSMSTGADRSRRQIMAERLAC